MHARARPARRRRLLVGVARGHGTGRRGRVLVVDPRARLRDGCGRRGDGRGAAVVGAGHERRRGWGEAGGRASPSDGRGGEARDRRGEGGSRGCAAHTPGCATHTRGCATDTRGCATDTRGCATDTRGCATDTRGCATDTRGCATDTRGCATDTRGCATDTRGCVTGTRGCVTGTRGCATYALECLVASYCPDGGWPCSEPGGPDARSDASLLGDGATRDEHADRSRRFLARFRAPTTPCRFPERNRPRFPTTGVRRRNKAGARNGRPPPPSVGARGHGTERRIQDVRYQQKTERRPRYSNCWLGS